MICEHKDEKRMLKYVDPIAGSKKILIRFEGDWVSWGMLDPNNKQHKPAELTITEKGAILIATYRDSFDEDVPRFGLMKDEEYLQHVRYILDFEFVTRIVEVHGTRMDGTPLVMEGEEYHPTNPRIEKWSCELHH